MQTANQILNFSFSPVTLSQAAKNAFPANIIRLNELRIDKLKKIIEEVGETAFKFKGETLIPQVFKKFKAIMKKGGLPFETFEKRELRTLTYSLSHSEHTLSQIFSNVNELDFVFETLEKNWKDSYLIGLIDCYLKNWQTKHIASSEKLAKYIFDKLRKYEGGRIVYKSLKANIKFFDSRNGDVVLGTELAIKYKHIKDATKYLLLPDSWFSYPYFSRVIIAYYEKAKKNLPLFLDELGSALEIHSNSVKGTKSNKLLVSKLIQQGNLQEFENLQEKLKSIAFKLVGDPGNVANWAPFENATDSDKEDLRKGRSILNEWLTRQFINVFFEKCINDSRRKRFWLKYAKQITQFRVVGSSFVKHILMNDNRIAEYVLPRFSDTSSTRNSNAALMFIIKNHLFIEFSDNGAFYAYKLSNPKAPSIEKQYFISTASLKTPSMNLLAYRTGVYIGSINEEGRLTHIDGDLAWEQVAEYWIKEIAGINV